MGKITEMMRFTKKIDSIIGYTIAAVLTLSGCDRRTSDKTKEDIQHTSPDITNETLKKAVANIGFSECIDNAYTSMVYVDRQAEAFRQSGVVAREQLSHFGDDSGGVISRNLESSQASAQDQYGGLIRQHQQFAFDACSQASKIFKPSVPRIIDPHAREVLIAVEN